VSGCASHGDLVGGYVLGALDPEEREEMQRHLETCEACRREYEALLGLPELLDRIEPADVPPPVPSGALEDAVLDRVARERGRRRAVRRRRPRIALAAAGAAALAAIAVAIVLALPGEDEAYAEGRLTGTPGAGGRFTVERVPAGTRVSLDVNGLGARRAYELWCVRTNGRWVSGGTFQPRKDGNADVDLTAAVRPGDYHWVVITGRGAKPPDYEPQVLKGKLRY
jgi:anti-sigma-K factor RskA